MSQQNDELSIVPAVDYSVEFRAYSDDAWYSVAVILNGETLRIKYSNFSDENDNLFKPNDFRTLKQLNEFEQRFRPLSKQIQDDECRQLVEGVRVCACYYFSKDDVRFYDGVVDAVQESEHLTKEEEELCLCTFILNWLHGPNAGNLTATMIENICLVQPALELDPVVDSFLKIARERAEYISSHSTSMSKGVPGQEMVPYCNEAANTARKLGFFERMQKEKRCARKSIVGVCSSEVSCHNKRMEDSDLEGVRNPCMILIGNLEKGICPSTITEFLRRHTSVSPGVFMFPSLSSEIYTRAAIVLGFEKDFRKLCDFLYNPSCIITSSSGRPWVIIEKLVGLKQIKASVGTVVPSSKNILQNGNSETSNNLKVVCSGTKEFEIARELRNLVLAFSAHQERLYKKLALEETRIFAAKSF